MPPEEPPKLPEIPPNATYDVPALAALLHVQEKTVREWFTSGELRGRYLGRGRGWVTTGRRLLDFLETGPFEF